MCRRGEHGSGGESCVAERKGFALPVCKPPPGCRPGGGQVVPMAASGCRCRPFSPDFAGKTPAAGWLSFPYCPNMETNVLIFASSLSFRPLLLPHLVKFSVFGCFGSRLLPFAGWSRHGGRGSPPLAVAVGQLFSPEHRPPGDSPSLPSPPLFSFGQCFPLVVSVPRWCFPVSGVPLGFLVLVSAPLGMVVYGGIFFFIQPRPE